MKMRIFMTICDMECALWMINTNINAKNAMKMRFVRLFVQKIYSFYNEIYRLFTIYLQVASESTISTRRVYAWTLPAAMPAPWAFGASWSLGKTRVGSQSPFQCSALCLTATLSHRILR